MASFPNTVTCSGGTTSVTVPGGGANLTITNNAGTNIVITWTAQSGNTFPALAQAFSWKSGFAPTITVNLTQPSSTVIQLTYTMPSSKVTWKYNMKLNGCNQVDPDINNDPPGGDEDKDDQGKGRGDKANKQ